MRPPSRISSADKPAFAGEIETTVQPGLELRFVSQALGLRAGLALRALLPTVARGFVAADVDEGWGTARGLRPNVWQRPRPRRCRGKEYPADVPTGAHSNRWPAGKLTPPRRVAGLISGEGHVPGLSVGHEIPICSCVEKRPVGRAIAASAVAFRRLCAPSRSASGADVLFSSATLVVGEVELQRVQFVQRHRSTSSSSHETAV